jgi:hypothetical protein
MTETPIRGCTEKLLASMDRFLLDVDFIASGYEWICPHCEFFQKEIEAPEEVTCRSCRKVCLVNDVAHANA